MSAQLLECESPEVVLPKWVRVYSGPHYGRIHQLIDSGRPFSRVKHIPTGEVFEVLTVDLEEV